MIWVVIGVVIVLVGVIFFLASRRRTPDGVTTFQRQIDALSPEARRPVVKRLKDVERRRPDPGPPTEPPRPSLADPGLLGPARGGSPDGADDPEGGAPDGDAGTTALSDDPPLDELDERSAASPDGADERDEPDEGDRRDDGGPAPGNPGIVDPGLDAVRRRDEGSAGGVDGA